jgi:hypothetical protein
MDKRKLKDGTEVDDFEKPIDLIIHTKAPGKWLLIDLETGQEYFGSDFAHETFAEKLRLKVQTSKIGSWIKIKDKNGKNIT